MFGGLTGFGQAAAGTTQQQPSMFGGTGAFGGTYLILLAFTLLILLAFTLLILLAFTLLILLALTLLILLAFITH